MKRKNKINIPGFIILVVMSVLFSFTPAYAIGELGKKESKNRIEEVCKKYSSWKTASWQGKVSADFLPLKLTAKVFMESDKLILASLRAPLFGEVARIEIDREKVVLVNKMNKKYWSHPISQYENNIPNILPSLQAALLGRVFILGSGEIKTSHSGNVTIYDLEDGFTYISPDSPGKYDQLFYGFALDGENKIVNLVMLLEQLTSTEGNSNSTPEDDATKSDSGKRIVAQIAADIEPRSNGADANLMLEWKGMKMNLEIDAGEIEYGVTGFDRINLSRYQATDLRSCLKF